MKRVVWVTCIPICQFRFGTISHHHVHILSLHTNICMSMWFRFFWSLNIWSVHFHRYLQLLLNIFWEIIKYCVCVRYTILIVTYIWYIPIPCTCIRIINLMLCVNEIEIRKFASCVFFSSLLFFFFHSLLLFCFYVDAVVFSVVDVDGTVAVIFYFMFHIINTMVKPTYIAISTKAKTKKNATNKVQSTKEKTTKKKKKRKTNNNVKTENEFTKRTQQHI